MAAGTAHTDWFSTIFFLYQTLPTNQSVHIPTDKYIPFNDLEKLTDGLRRGRRRAKVEY